MVTKNKMLSEHSSALAEKIAITCKAGNVPIIWGDPGIGKTAMVEQLAKDAKRKLFVVIGSTMEPTDIAGLPVPQEGKDGFIQSRYTDPDFLAFVRKYKGEVVLLFDEFLSTPPVVQNSLLTAIQSRRLPGGRFLPDNVWMILASNPMEQTLDGTELSLPMSNRLVHFNAEVDKEFFVRNFPGNFGKGFKESAEADTRAIITGFLNRNRAMIHDMPEVGSGYIGGWCSPRSWDNLARQVAMYKDGFRAPGIKMDFVGTVGEAAYIAFSSYFLNDKLPVPSEIIADPKNAVVWESLKPDQIYAIFAGVSSVVPDKPENLAKTLLGIAQVYAEASKHLSPDGLAVCCGLLESLFMKTRVEYDLRDGTGDVLKKNEIYKQLLKILLDTPFLDYMKKHNLA